MKKKLPPDFIFDSVAVANPAATSMKLDFAVPLAA